MSIHHTLPRMENSNLLYAINHCSRWRRGDLDLKTAVRLPNLNIVNIYLVYFTKQLLLCLSVLASVQTGGDLVVQCQIWMRGRLLPE